MVHQPKPEGTVGPEAEALAQKLFTAINKEAWDTTRVVSWTFAGMNQYVWDRERHWVEAKWKDYTVLLKIDEKSGKVWEGETLIEGKEKEELLKEAWKKWVNDSFWMNAPSKAMDPGTQRSLVEGEDGRQGLMVSYQSGGATPGDSYLWWLDEKGLPTSWQMWVSVIPIGGLEVSWEGWKTLETGAKVSESHTISGITLEVSDIRGASSIQGLMGADNPFLPLE